MTLFRCSQAKNWMVASKKSTTVVLFYLVSELISGYFEAKVWAQTEIRSVPFFYFFWRLLRFRKNEKSPLFPHFMRTPGSKTTKKGAQRPQKVSKQFPSPATKVANKPRSEKILQNRPSEKHRQLPMVKSLQHLYSSQEGKSTF